MDLAGSLILVLLWVLFTKCQYGRLGDHALSARRCWAPSDDGVGQSSVEESGLGLYGCVMNVVMKYSPC